MACSAQALHSIGVVSFESFSDADPRKIEMVTGRKYPFGNHIKESLHSLPPKVEMKLEETVNQMQGKSKLIVTLTRLSESLPSTKRHYADMVCSRQHSSSFCRKALHVSSCLDDIYCSLYKYQLKNYLLTDG